MTYNLIGLVMAPIFLLATRKEINKELETNKNIENNKTTKIYTYVILFVFDSLCWVNTILTITAGTISSYILKKEMEEVKQNENNNS